MGFSRLYIIDMDIIQMTNTEQITNENWNEEGKAEMLAEWIEHKYDGDMFEMANKINELLASQKQQILDAVEKGRIKVTNNWAYTHDRDEEQYTKLSKEEININKGIDKALTIIKNL